MTGLCGLAPLGPHADQTADGTGDTDQAVVEGQDAQGGGWGGEIAQVGDELYPGGGALSVDVISAVLLFPWRVVDVLFDLLGLDNSLAFLAVHRLLLLLQPEEGVDPRDGAACQTGAPRAVRILLQTLGGGQLAVADGVDDGDGVEGQVAGVAELATDGQVAQDGVDGALVLQGDGGSLEVLDELADAHDLARGAELLLDGIVGVDGGLRAVGAVQVPGVEAGEVLQGTEKLVTTDWTQQMRLAVVSCFRLPTMTTMAGERTGCRDEAQPVRQRRVVEEGVSDHDGFARDRSKLRKRTKEGIRGEMKGEKGNEVRSVIDRRLDPRVLNLG